VQVQVLSGAPKAAEKPPLFINYKKTVDFFHLSVKIYLLQKI
jgi:hypothetical protein